MKNLIIPVCILLCASSLYAQEARKHYSVFNPNNRKKEFFITTNSGILNTPVGLKIGFLSSPGLYLGFRHGLGKVYHSDTDLTTSHTNLLSITAGTNAPLIIKNDFKLVAQLGIGYGEWWDYRWERWTKSGFEIEGGFMVKMKSFLINVTGNVLNGDRTYATADVCVGVGFVMNNCE